MPIRANATLTIVAGLLLLCGSASGAEVQIPDSCDGTVCLTGLRWKKGFLEHSLTGFLDTTIPLQSTRITFHFSDAKRSGSTLLHLKATSTKTAFYFKVLARSLKWEESSIKLNMTTISDIPGVKQDGVTCTFKSLGSRLAVTIRNDSDRDLILSYDLLTLTSSGENVKLNGTHGKYVNLSTPNPSTLITARSTQQEEFIPIGAATLEGSEWVESWTMHTALTAESPSLVLPFSENSNTRLEKLPLEPKVWRVALSAQGTPGR